MAIFGPWVSILEGDGHDGWGPRGLAEGADIFWGGLPGGQWCDHYFDLEVGRMTRGTFSENLSVLWAQLGGANFILFLRF